MKKLLIAATGATALLAGASVAHAQSEWRFTPYAWVASFDGTIGTAGNGSGLGDRVTFDFGKLSENLSLGGAMLNGSWRGGRWTAFGDWTYAKVESDAPTRVPNLYSAIEAEVKGNVVQGFAGYDLLGQKDTHLDVFGGVRYYDLDIEARLKGAAVADRSLRGDSQWADGVIGARWSTRFAGNWEAYVQADVGAGGSDLSWQAIAAVGYAWNWGTLLAGWRHLNVDYEDGDYRLDAALSGPIIGVSFKF